MRTMNETKIYHARLLAQTLGARLNEHTQQLVNQIAYAEREEYKARQPASGGVYPQVKGKLLENGKIYGPEGSPFVKRESHAEEYVGDALQTITAMRREI